MKLIKVTRLLPFAMVITLLPGCGNNSPGGEPVSVLESSSVCINCHTEAVSAGSGLKVTDEWKQSVHNSADGIPGKRFPGSGASCRDCHEPAAGHPNACNGCHNGPNVPVTDEVVRNPDAELKCNKCHARGAAYELPKSHYFPAKYLSTSATYDNISTTAYVTTKTVGKCTSCHNPHYVTRTPQHIDWAKSGHGDFTAQPWMHYDFKTRGTTGITPAISTSQACVRCHTTTGYINFVTSSFRNVSSWGTKSDPGKQTLYCNACHDNGAGRAYGWTVRNVPQVSAYYNYSIAKFAPKRLTRSVYPELSPQFPYIGASNNCMVCHVGSEAGVTLAAVDKWMNAQNAAGNLTLKNYSSYYNNLSFISSHYYSGGGTVYKTTGFEYGGLNYANPSHYLHDRIGISNTNGTGSSGPCVTCHMKPGRHTYKPFTYDVNGSIAAIASPVCVNCHKGAYELAPQTLNAERNGFNAALDALKAMLGKRGINYTPVYPYFTKNAGGAFVKWRKIETMGAAFNYLLLLKDPGAFAHNRYYAKRLIHDSIDWLATGAVTAWSIPQDVGSFGMPGNVENAINGLTTIDAATKSAAISYLLGTTANPGGAGGTRP